MPWKDNKNIKIKKDIFFKLYSLSLIDKKKINGVRNLISIFR